jgi:hypothetical protein
MTQEVTVSRIPYPPRFPFGQTVATPGVLEICNPHHLQICLYRHSRGDWGNICDEDKESNDFAVTAGNRTLSAYPIDPDQPCLGYADNRFWIITEADRSVTTALLPSEY